MYADLTSSTPGTVTDPWSSFFAQVLPIAAVIGPVLLLLGALCVSAGIQTLPDDLDWISEPVRLRGVAAIPLLFITWIVTSRTIARRAPLRTGIAGIAVLRTRIAPRWAGVAPVVFVPTLMAAQGAHVAIEVLYPLAIAFLLVGVAGVVCADREALER